MNRLSSLSFPRSPSPFTWLDEPNPLVTPQLASSSSSFGPQSSFASASALTSTSVVVPTFVLENMGLSIEVIRQYFLHGSSLADWYRFVLRRIDEIGRQPIQSIERMLYFFGFEKRMIDLWKSRLPLYLSDLMLSSESVKVFLLWHIACSHGTTEQRCFDRFKELLEGLYEYHRAKQQLNLQFLQKIQQKGIHQEDFYLFE
jgi:hypothetical protein